MSNWKLRGKHQQSPQHRHLQALYLWGVLYIISLFIFPFRFASCSPPLTFKKFKLTKFTPKKYFPLSPTFLPFSKNHKKLIVPRIEQIPISSPSTPLLPIYFNSHPITPNYPKPPIYHTSLDISLIDPKNPYQSKLPHTFLTLSNPYFINIYTPLYDLTKNIT